ncbi:serine hydrolase domain-containing protein [Chitinasiproducens palmae]|uniref:CubicO group peptidase, beta-lactamase class C family n=1 Tax=Chitinasiproducens palmae TaxID=1770053 RepID=A0A1H2PNN3_9BURK|nr:serine hydrolase domain-containing protein [Chitinasiproducens palmae]SDV48299.1 CubicO group peptidase, beta-lactamase class C family [Chitinasiproducens palmae]
MTLCNGARRRFLGRAGALSLSAAGIPSAFAQADGMRATIAPLVRTYLQRWSLPGLSLAVGRGGHIDFAGAFGTADRANDERLTPAARMRIASLSKAFTSTAILRLIEAKALSLDTAVFGESGVLNQFSLDDAPHRDWLRAITVHHLLTHTCGGWDNTRNDPMFETPRLDHAQLIAHTLATHPLQAPPGTRYAYSNFGYCVLGRVIERIGALPYQQYVNRTMLHPLGIADMRIATREPAPGETRYFDAQPASPYDMPIFRMDSHGGWIATPSDLVRFVASVFAATDGSDATPLLTPASVATARQGTAANPHYGCGWVTNAIGNTWHNGSLPGTSSIMVHTRHGLCWAAIVNARRPDTQQEAELDRLMWDIVRTQPQWQA